MDIYGLDADELAHCVALHVIEKQMHDSIEGVRKCRKCRKVLRCMMESAGWRASTFPFAILVAGMERVLPSDGPSNLGRKPLVQDLWAPGSPRPLYIPRTNFEARAFLEEATQVLHFLYELADVDGPPHSPLELLLDDVALTLRELVYP